MPSSLSGVYCAAATPFDADLNVDAPRMVDHCRTLIANGCHGVALLGSTGEANSLSVAERKALLEAVVEGGVAAYALLPGVGVCAAAETVELTRHALGLGVSTVIMLPPFYYKDVTDQGLADSYSRIFDAVGDQRLRVLLYHIPPIAKISISHGLIRTLRERFPRMVVGLKDSSGDLNHMVGLVKEFPDFAVFAGADPLMRPLLSEGGAGCITATSNLLARELRTIFDGFRNPSAVPVVDAAQADVVAVRNISNTFPQIPTIKAMLSHRSGQEGWVHVRPPLVSLSDDQQRILSAKLREHDQARRAASQA